MTVERPHVAESKLFEDDRCFFRRRNEAHRAHLRARKRLARGTAKRHVFEHVLGTLAHEVRKGLAAQHREIRGDRADVGGDRHLVVVENHDEVRVELPGVVECLVREATGQRSVAQHRNDRLVAAGEIARHGHAVGRRNRRRGMSRAERIVFRLGAHREARNAAAFAQRLETVATPGKNLVYVRLVRNVPDEFVFGEVEHAVQCKRESTTPRFGARWPPLREHVTTSMSRISRASTSSWSRESALTSAGVSIRSITIIDRLSFSMPSGDSGPVRQGRLESETRSKRSSRSKIARPGETLLGSSLRSATRS